MTFAILLGSVLAAFAGVVFVHFLSESIGQDVADAFQQKADDE